jgi:outer membrane protein assembly factor BamB
VAAIDLRTHRVSDWPPAAGGPVSALATADGTLAVGGEFDTARAAARRDLAALDPESGRPVPLRMDVDGEFAAVEALAVGDSTLFVGGYFAAVQGVDRRDLAAIDLDEGRVADWSPRIQGYAYGNGLLAVHDGVVYVAPPPEDYEPPLRAIDTGSAEVLPWRPVPEDYGEPVGAMAAKGSRVYLAGDFRSIDGINRRTLAAVDAESGEVLEWDPRPNGEEGAVALAISDGTLYVGGDFTEIAGTRRFGAAAFDVESGELLDWAPNLRGGIPYAIATDESAVFFGGDFKSVGGQPRAGLAAVDPVAGRPLPWRVRVELGDFEAVRDLVVADSTLYFAGDFEQVNGVPQTGLAAVRLR